jgi:hypothetical protein
LALSIRYRSNARRLAWSVQFIEQDRAAFELQIDKDAGVAERSIDELRVEYGPHARNLGCSSRISELGGPDGTGLL